MRKPTAKSRLTKQCEVLSTVGDVALGDDGKPSLHVHAVLGLSDGTTRGGHLLEAIVRPTLEITLVEATGHLRRRKRPEIGAALIDVRIRSVDFQVQLERTVSISTVSTCCAKRWR